MIGMVVMLLVLLNVVSSTANAQEKFASWSDSLAYIQTLKAPGEPTLQQLLSSLGYSINVATDETGLGTFCALPGQNIATIVLEYAGSAVSAKSGWYVANDSSVLHQLFQGINVPGDSTQFTVTAGDSIGFYMKPGLSGQESTVWFTQTGMNSDLFDHAWVFRTGIPHEYIVAWEDLPNGGDNDHQDLVLKIRFANQVPVVTLRPDSSVLQCALAQICLPVSATDANCEGDTLTLIMTSGAGTFTQIKQKGPINATHCFTPTAPGIYQFIFKVTDIVGASSYDTTNITVAVNQPPVATCPGNVTLFRCDLSPITIDGFNCTDVDGNLTSCAVNNGTLNGTQVTFTPVAGVNTITLTATDACGVTSTCQTTVTVNLNSAPVATCPGNETRLVCDLSPITIMGFSCSDVDNNLTSCAVDKGTLSGNAVTFTPVAGANVITLTATDACGMTSTCQTTVTVNVNSAPVATCPGNETRLVCDLSPITITGFSCSDVDNNLTSCAVDKGTLSGNAVTFTPVAGANVITLTATDACGQTSNCQTTVTVNLNSAPVATCPGNVTLFRCDLLPITIDGFNCTDVDGNLTSCAVNNGTLNGTQVTFTPVAGVNTITLTATDACGKTSSCQTTVTVNLNSAPVATCPGDQTVFRCNLADMTIGGFSCSDPDGNLVSCTVDKGTLSGNEVTFEPVVGLNIITLTATDACGATSTCQARITVIENEVPSVDMPDNDTLFLGTTQQFCYTIGVTDPDYPVYESLPQGHLVDGAGILANNILCFTPTQGIDSLYWFVVEVCDSCGIPVGRGPRSPINSCVTDSFFVLVRFNHPPVVVCPSNTSATFSCGPAEVCVDGFSATDPDNNIVSQTVSLGTLSGGRVCFMPDTAGVYTIIYTVTDAMGATAECQTEVTVVYSNNPPAVTCRADTAITVCQLDQICLSGFSCSDPDNNLVSCAATGGTLNGNTVCLTPVAGVNTITLTATDACGLTASCVTRVTVTVVDPPQISDTIRTVTMCAPGQACVNLPQVTGGQAPYTWRYKGEVVTGGQICFTLFDDSTVTGAITVTDNCGRTDAATMIVNAVVNTAPVVSVTVTSPQFLCQAGAQVCAKLTIVDPDNGLSGTSTIGTVRLADSTVCFPADTAGHYCNRVIISDACGLKDTVTYCVDVAINRAPICNLPQSTSFAQCEPAQVCLPVSAADQDGNLVGCQIVDGPGFLMNGNWCYKPTGSESVTVRIRCTDQCGAFCEGSFTVAFDVDSPPVVSCHADTSFVMPSLHEICLSGFNCSDPDGNLVSCSSNRGPITGGEICFMPEEGLNSVVVTAEDACGNVATCTTRVAVVIVRECPVVRIEKTEGSLQGHIVTVNVTIENAGLFEIGGFDLLLGYESAALTFVDAEPGDLLTDCGWEYFIYRFGPDGNCGNGCPSGMLRLIAMAEVNNGPNHPDCSGPTDLAAHGLAKLQFLVTNDRTFECQYLPVYFTWLNCGDNGFSNIEGDSLIVDSKIFDFEGNIIWDEFDDDVYPNDERLPFMGADDDCLIGFKFAPYRCLEFWNGGVDVVCADSIDARGDVNLNGIANEVADAVLLTNYFVQGLQAFYSPEGSIAASDVNSDGIALSVADLVYLIRIIVGDAAPYAKPIPNSSLTVTTQATAEGLAVAYEASDNIGAMLLTFAVNGSEAQPILGPGADGMDVLSGVEGNELRVLVYNIGSHSIAAGNNTLLVIPGDGEITLTGVEAADYYGGVMAVSTRNLPTSFELAQNYPNPFNPTTTIKLSLAAASEWSVSIYNISGQKVRAYSGFSQPGTVTVTWDATDSNGNRLSSGIYLYRATAGSFSETRKMVLMK